MGDLYYRDMLRQVWKNKRWIAACMVACVILAGFMGYRKGIAVKQDVANYQAERENYTVALEGYDAAIESAQKTLDEAKEQLEDYQTYCDESILMQIDAKKEWVATFQRQIVSPDGAIMSNVTNALLAYVNTGNFKEKLSAAVSDSVASEYISELVSCSNQSYVVTVKIIQKDEKNARTMLDAAEKIFDAQIGELQKSLGEFEVQDYAKTVYETVDAATLTTQTNNSNTLKSLQNAVTDYENKLISQQNTKNTYAENNLPEEVTVKSRKVILVQYMVLGAFVGFIVGILSMLVRYMTGVHLHYKEELENASWDVIGTYSPKKKEEKGLESGILQIQCLKEKRQCKELGIFCLGNSEELQEGLTIYRKKLADSRIKGTEILFTDSSKENMENALNCDSSVCIVAAGCTKFTDIEQYKAFCKKYEIEMWGCIFVG